jgi:hypothetical protein
MIVCSQKLSNDGIDIEFFDFKGKKLFDVKNLLSKNIFDLYFIGNNSIAISGSQGYYMF